MPEVLPKGQALRGDWRQDHFQHQKKNLHVLFQCLHKGYWQHQEKLGTGAPHGTVEEEGESLYLW